LGLYTIGPGNSAAPRGGRWPEATESRRGKRRRDLHDPGQHPGL